LYSLGEFFPIRRRITKGRYVLLAKRSRLLLWDFEWLQRVNSRLLAAENQGDMGGLGRKLPDLDRPVRSGFFVNSPLGEIAW